MELRELRKRAGLKSAEIAKILEVTQGHYSHIELGKRTLKEEFIPILAAVFGVSEKEIIEIRDQMQKKNIQLKHWIDQVLIDGKPMIIEISKQIRYGRSFNLDDEEGFPIFIANLVSDIIREVVRVELKNDGRFREILRQRLKALL